jgi:hypothetical protein
MVIKMCARASHHGNTRLQQNSFPHPEADSDSLTETYCPFALSAIFTQRIDGWSEGWETGQHYLALQFGCENELRPDCSKAVPVEKLCFLPIELALLRNDKN